MSGHATFVLSPLSTALCLSLLSFPAHGAVYVRGYPSSEDAAFLHFEVHRNADANLVQRVDYFTQDITAVAGVHYVMTTGTVVFGAGQTVAGVKVPLIDNGLVDGDKSVYLMLRNASPGMEIWNDIGAGRIRDNELPPTLLDPSFIPDDTTFSFVMPDGRILSGLTMLQPNGWVDPAFVPGGTNPQPLFDPLHVYDDGRILGWHRGSAQAEPGLVRLFASGHIEKALDMDLPENSRFLAVQSDGRLLMSMPVPPAGGSVNSSLFRFNDDGSLDAGFNAGAIRAYVSSVKIQADGKILVIALFDKGDGVYVFRLARLNPDGSLDSGFSPDGEVDQMFLRRSGKIVVRRRVGAPPPDWEIVQFNADGTVDPAFRFELYADQTDLGIWAEEPDGRFVIIAPVGGDLGLRRLNVDGSLDPDFAPAMRDTHTIRFEYDGFPPTPRLALTPSGHVLFRGNFTAVDRFPVQPITLRDGYWLEGFIRLRNGSPEPEFRPIYAPQCDRSADEVVIHIVRTGDTTTAASVDFSTGDDTARGGVDYLPRSGTLNFAPLEVGKQIRVPLLPRIGVMERQRFHLRLINPSSGYGTTTPIPVVLWPEMRLSTERLLSENKIVLEGTIPGLRYALDNSSDLRGWAGNPASRAMAPVMEFDVGPPNAVTQFYRGRRE